MNYIYVIWYLFCLFVITSFLWFGRTWLRDPRRWHIGYMSTSYSLLCLLVAANGKLSEQMSIVLGALVMALGIAGLLQYWLRYGDGTEEIP